MNILVLHGINLNMFGKRDPAVYGTHTLADIDSSLRALAHELSVAINCFHTNHEGAMVERIHLAHAQGVNAVLINAGAWTHYSLGIRDALEILSCPVVEVHMSNVHAREPFRRHSVFADIRHAEVSGLGVESYLKALRDVVAHLRSR